MPTGGKRPGAGRPKGSPNRMPLRGSKLEQQMDEYKSTVLGAVPFKGDSLELLRAIYRGEYVATHDQIYAAGQVLRFEHPPAVTVDGRSVEQIREEVRREFTEGEDYSEKIIAQLDRMREVHEREEQLKWRALIDEGTVTGAQAEAVRA